MVMRDRLQSRECARYLKALADEDRLRIVQCLQTGPKNVTELSALLGQELANVSHHLGVLRNAGIVRDEKQGKFVIYSLHPDIFRPAAEGQTADALDLGCCRIDLTGR
jgi:ArsR family transcriptional regulator